MFNITLISTTPHALETLLFTKATRLSLDPQGFEEIKDWPIEKKMQELDYLRQTIQSSFEFVDYLFCITGVSRSFTQQLERHRVGTSFAEKTLRMLDMSGFEFVTGPSIAGDKQREFHYGEMMGLIDAGYRWQIAHGAKTQDARGLLPMNVETGICFKGNLRTLHNMGLTRLCVKTQGEFQNVFRALKAAVVAVHPWAEPFIRVWCATYGTCQFHNHPVAECPTKPYVYNPHTTQSYGGGPLMNLVQIQEFWEAHRAETDKLTKVPSSMDKIQNGQAENPVCPCWSTGVFKLVEGCNLHPWDL